MIDLCRGWEEKAEAMEAPLGIRSPGQRRPWSGEQIERLRRAVPRVLRGLPEVIAAYLFGSALQPGQVGDIDLALLPRPGATLSMGQHGRVVRELRQALGPGAPEIDLRMLRPRLARLAHEVRRDGELLYEADSQERAWIECDLERRYLDERWLQQVATVVPLPAGDLHAPR